MSGKQEKRKRKAAGVDLKAQRQEKLDRSAAHAQALREAYLKHYGATKGRISARGIAAVASAMAVGPTHD